jgi:hypothetical protein
MPGRDRTPRSHPPAGGDRAEVEKTARQRRRPWTPDDDDQLKRELLAGIPIDQVAESLGRTLTAVKTRLPFLRIALNGPGNPPSERKMDHLLKRKVDLGLKAKKR